MRVWHRTPEARRVPARDLPARSTDTVQPVWWASNKGVCVRLRACALPCAARAGEGDRLGMLCGLVVVRVCVRGSLSRVRVSRRHAAHFVCVVSSRTAAGAGLCCII